MAVTAIEFRGIDKAFGPVQANRNCSFSVDSHTIHGVVGENGAGKSTICKILYGLYQADRGDILISGTPHRIATPQQAIRLGIGMVHQHFMLVPTLPVWANVILGHEPRKWNGNRQIALEILSKLQSDFGFSLDLEARVDQLPVGLQQQVEILKLLYRKANFLILDEPTAVLTPREVDTLLERLLKLRESGKTVLFISHKLREILRFTQAVTVMRQGEVVCTRPTSQFTETSLAECMVGRSVAALPKERKPPGSQVRLAVKHLRVRREDRAVIEDLSFEIRAGEVVGIAGVEGNGQQELMEVLANVNRDYEGEVLLDGSPMAAQKTYDLKQNGLAVVPADRHREGLVLDFSVEENVLLGHHKEARYRSLHGALDQTKIRDEVTQLIEKYDVRPKNPETRISALSGGNQQKVIIGREMSQPVRLLIAAHPTRGVDIGAIEFIHSQCLRLRDSGAAVLVISSELDEILALADRVFVLYEGRIQGETTRAEADEAKLGFWMTGGRL